jgi:hypothetical protein
VVDTRLGGNRSPAKLACAQHPGQIVLFLQKRACQFMFAAEVQCGHNARCHHFGIAHSALRVFFVLQGVQQIGTKTLYEYTVVVHERFLS